MQQHSQAGIALEQSTLNDWQLKFSPDYKQQIAVTLLDDATQQLQQYFQQEENFQLNEESTVVIKTQDLAEKLGCSIEQVRERKNRLIQTGIIQQNRDANISWKQNKTEARKTIDLLFAALERFYQELSEYQTPVARPKLKISEAWLKELAHQEQEEDPTFNNKLVTFLTLCAGRKAEEWQVLEHFTKLVKTDPKEPFIYQEKEPHQTRPLSQKILGVLKSIIEQHTSEDTQSESNTWQYHDLLQGSRDGQQRFERALFG